MNFLDRVTQAYLECAKWTSDEEIEVLEGLGIWELDWADDVDVSDVANFLEIPEVQEAIKECSLEGSEVGHDLWLTQNGHGVGFWDRDLGEHGDTLTEHADKFGVRYVFLDEDGKLQIEKG